MVVVVLVVVVVIISLCVLVVFVLGVVVVVVSLVLIDIGSRMDICVLSFLPTKQVLLLTCVNMLCNSH